MRYLPRLFRRKAKSEPVYLLQYRTYETTEQVADNAPARAFLSERPYRPGDVSRCPHERTFTVGTRQICPSCTAQREVL